jgi:hypothetical protein
MLRTKKRAQLLILPQFPHFGLTVESINKFGGVSLSAKGKKNNSINEKSHGGIDSSRKP